MTKDNVVKRMKELAGINEGTASSAAYGREMMRGGWTHQDALDVMQVTVDQGEAIDLRKMSDSQKLETIIKFMKKQEQKWNGRLHFVFVPEGRASFSGVNIGKYSDYMEATGGRKLRITDPISLGTEYDLYDPKLGTIGSNIRGTRSVFNTKYDKKTFRDAQWISWT